MAKKSKSAGLGGKSAPKSTKGMTQKIGAHEGGAVSGMNFGSTLEKAATTRYLGHNLKSGITNGAMGLLAGTGGSKSVSIPNASGSLGRKGKK